MTETTGQANVNGSSSSTFGTLRLNNIQKIQLRKQQVQEWTNSRKLEKLAIYSSCKARSITSSGLRSLNFSTFLCLSHRLKIVVNAMVGKTQQPLQTLTMPLGSMLYHQQT